LTTLREWVRRKRPEMWKNGLQIHHDMPAHDALFVKTFLVKRKIPVLEHPPYSPDLAPCNFVLLPQDKVHRSIENKSDGGKEEAIRKGSAALLPTVENSHGVVQGSGRGQFESDNISIA
jgi:hypothetical protein